MSWAWATLPLALAGGWRQNGDGVVPAAPAELRELWTVSLPDQGHGSPVVGGDCVWIVVEPDTLRCHRLRDGVVTWEAPHPILGALPADTAAVIRGGLQRVPGLRDERTAPTRRHAELLRAARGGADVDADLAAVVARQATVDAELATWAVYEARKVDDIGFAAATPWVTPDAVFALFGHGVIARHDPHGHVVWQRWLGRAPTDKWGYRGGDTASPVLVDDTLLVPYGALRGLDPMTGQQRWAGPAWPHFGSPTVTTVDGVALVVTPAGQVVRVSDGAVLTSGLAAVSYTSPTARGADVWFVGGDGDVAEGRPNHAAAWRLAQGGTTAQPRWRVPVESRDRFYATPVVVGDHLIAITRHRGVHAWRADTGELVHRSTLDALHGEVMAPLTVAGDSVWVSGDGGGVVELAAHPPFEVRRVIATPAGPSTPWVSPSSLVHRGRRALSFYAAP